MYTFCHSATIVMTNCIIISQQCSSACYHGMWCHNSINWHHNSSTMTTCNRKYKWLPCIQQQMLFEVLRIGGLSKSIQNVGQWESTPRPPTQWNYFAMKYHIRCNQTIVVVSGKRLRIEFKWTWKWGGQEVQNTFLCPTSLTLVPASPPFEPIIVVVTSALPSSSL